MSSVTRGRRGPRAAAVVLRPALAALLVAAVAVTGAAEERLVAGAETEWALPSVPASYRERAHRGGTVTALSLEDAMRRALASNLDLEMARVAPAQADEGVRGARGAYDPVLGVLVGREGTSQPTVSELEAGEEVNSLDEHTFVAEAGVEQLLPRGGRLSLRLDTYRNETNSTFVTLNPTHAADLRLELRQPLARGLGWPSERRDLSLARLDADVADLELERAVAELLVRVRDAYWELSRAVGLFELRREFLELALRQVELVDRRVAQGVSARSELAAARAEAAVRELDVLESEVAVLEAESGLTRLLAAGPDDPLWRSSIVTTQDPAVRPLEGSFDELSARALAARPELRRAELELERASVEKRFRTRDRLPTTDLVATYDSAARTGTSLVDLDGDTVPEKVPLGGYGDAVADSFGGDFPSWSVFLDVRVPLPGRTGRAGLAIAALEVERSRVAIRGVRQSILAEVQVAHDALALQDSRVRAARRGVALSREQLRFENTRYRLGESDLSDVLRAQRELAEARERELEELVQLEGRVTVLMRSTHDIADLVDRSRAEDAGED